MYAGVPTTLEVTLSNDRRHPKVEDLPDRSFPTAPYQEQVSWIDVPMHDRKRVGSVETIGHLFDQTHHLAQGKPGPMTEPFG